jgi:hypothetical protein
MPAPESRVGAKRPHQPGGGKIGHCPRGDAEKFERHEPVPMGSFAKICAAVAAHAFEGVVGVDHAAVEIEKQHAHGFDGNGRLQARLAFAQRVFDLPALRGFVTQLRIDALQRARAFRDLLREIESGVPGVAQRARRLVSGAGARGEALQQARVLGVEMRVGVMRDGPHGADDQAVDAPGYMQGFVDGRLDCVVRRIAASRAVEEQHRVAFFRGAAGAGVAGNGQVEMPRQFALHGAPAKHGRRPVALGYAHAR